MFKSFSDALDGLADGPLEDILDQSPRALIPYLPRESGDRRWLEALMADGGFATIGDLLEEAEEIFAFRGAAARRALLRALGDLVLEERRKMRAAADAQTPATTQTAAPTQTAASPQTPATPQTTAPATLDLTDIPRLARTLNPDMGPALLAWAQSAGATQLLSTYAFSVVPEMFYRHASTVELCFPRRPGVSVRDLLLVDPPPRVTDAVVELKGTILRKLAEEAAQVARARAYYAAERPEDLRPTAVPELAPLVDVLRDAYLSLREQLPPRHPRTLFPVHRLIVNSTRARPALEASLGTAHTTPTHVTISLTRWKRGLEWHCNDHGGAVAHCHHVLVALEDSLRALCADPPGEVAAAVRRLLEQPAWARVLEQLEVEEQRHQEAEAELGWWVQTNSMGQVIGVQAVVKRRGKRGDWLQPKPVTLEALGRGELEVDESDRATMEVATLLKAQSSWGRNLLPSVLSALAGNKRVIGGPKIAEATPISIERVEPTLELRHADGEVVLEYVFPHARTPPVDDGEILGDVQRGRLFVVRLTRAVRLATQKLREVLPDVTEQELPALAERVARLDPSVRLSAPNLVPLDTVTARDHWTLRLAARDDKGLEARLLVQPIAGGPHYPAGDLPEVALAPGAEGRLTAARRDLPRERDHVSERWVSWGLEPTPDHTQIVAGAEASLSFLARVRDDPRGVVEWSTKPVRVLPRAARLRVSFESGADWFGLRGEVDMEEHRASLALLLDAARNKTPFVRVAEDTWLELEQNVLERLRALEPHVRGVRKRLEVGTMSLAAVTELVQQDATSPPPPSWTELVGRARAATTATPTVPESLQATLRDYQVEGFVWMARLATWGAGAVLADDMGLGKTVQTIAVLLARAELGPALVLAPTSVTHNWRRELARFAPSLRVMGGRDPGEPGPGTVMITSYGLLLKDRERLAAQRFATLVIDEAQAIKNPTSLRAQATRELNADWRIALSGTPIENHLGELWSVFAAVSPGLLGSWDHFRTRWLGLSGPALDGLRRLVRPFLLRRTKGEVLTELPPKTEITVDVELSSAERTIYEDARVAAAAHLRDLGSELTAVTGRFQVLAALMRLRQLACDASLVVNENPPPSSKLVRFVELASGLVAEGHAVLAFSQFTRLLDRAQAQLQAAEVPWLRLDGETPAHERGDIVERFQSGGPRVLLVSLRAGGTGLNLTAADYVIHLDPWWNPAVEDQATDRAHRIGQLRPVTVLRMVSRGTVESTILELHAAKRALAADVFDGGGAALEALSAEALLALITGAESGGFVDPAEDAGPDR